MGLRRRLSRVLARWAVRVDPDPPLASMDASQTQYTVLAQAIADIANGQIVGLGRKPPPDGTTSVY